MTLDTINPVRNIISNGVNIRRAWRRTFWYVYDNLGLLLAINILWLLFSITIIFFPVATAGLFYVAYLIIQERPVKVKDFFISFNKYFLKSTFLVFFLFTLYFVFIFNIVFYLKRLGILGLVLSGISFWLLLFTKFASIYIFPLLCRNKRTKDAIKYSYILLFDNFKITLITFFYLLILFFVELLLPIMGMGIISVFIQNVFLEIEKRYNPKLEISEPERKFRELFKIWES